MVAVVERLDGLEPLAVLACHLLTQGHRLVHERAEERNVAYMTTRGSGRPLGPEALGFLLLVVGVAQDALGEGFVQEGLGVVGGHLERGRDLRDQVDAGTLVHGALSG